MNIKQFEDKHLSHFSYAILNESEKSIVLIDPARNPQQYIDYAEEHGATIQAVVETHPHADFVSSHMELHQKLQAKIYASKLTSAHYPHETFDEGDILTFGEIKLSAINTPGHSPDSISILMEHQGKQHAVFTGDTLFIGDCGRPDLRETAGNITSKRQDLAKQMYHSLRDKLAVLNEDVLVYPAHGAGTLCGKNLSKASSSTIGAERQSNWSLQDATEEEFIKNLLADQPFVPAYFGFDVELNRKGAPSFSDSIAQVKVSKDFDAQTQKKLDANLWIVDTRKEDSFKNGHLPHSVNLMEDGKFETWLGSIIKPEEKFYLVSEDAKQLQRMLERVAAIGYEQFVAEGFVVNDGEVSEQKLDVADFKANTDDYTIVDIRNATEVAHGKIFPESIAIPLSELRSRVNEIPTDKPVVVHCAGGYRSAAGSSLLQAKLNDNVKVFDLGEAVKDFQ